MRILLISHWFPPVISGSSFYAESLAEALNVRGHEVVVVTLDWGNEYAPAPNLPFPVHRLPVMKIPKLPFFYNLRLMGFANTSQNRKRLTDLTRRYRPHLIHCVNHVFDTSLLVARVAQLVRIPLVGSITTPVQHQNPWIQSLYRLADFLILGCLGVRKWDGIVSLDRTVHEYVGRVYGRETQKRSTVIPFGARLGSESIYGNHSREHPPRPQILMVGHIHPFRNPTQLIRAMPMVLDRFPDALLVIAGRVDLKEPLRVSRSLGLTQKQVVFLGETKHRTTVELMKSSRVFVHWLTGPYRALGTAAMEAMLCGTPVVTDVMEDLFGNGGIKNGVDVVLVNSKDPASVAEAVIRLLEDEDLRWRIGQAGRRFIQEHLAWDRIAQQMEHFYEKFLAEKTFAKETRLNQ